MPVNRDQVQQLKAAGYTYHELAEIAKCPTPAIMQLGQYGTQPDRPINLDVNALLKAKEQQKQPETIEQPKAEESVTEHTQETKKPK